MRSGLEREERGVVGWLDFEHFEIQHRQLPGVLLLERWT